jgi:hypothetical protein
MEMVTDVTMAIDVLTTRVVVNDGDNGSEITSDDVVVSCGMK